MISDNFHYVFTESAESDLDEALDYIANELMNPEAASAFADELSEKLDEICKTPKAGRPIHNPYIQRDDIRRILVKNYILYYLEDEDTETIVVLRIVYSRRDQDKILENLKHN